MSDRWLPLPSDVESRIIDFLNPDQRRWGKIEIDVQDGEVIQIRFIETVKPNTRVVALKESAELRVRT